MGRTQRIIVNGEVFEVAVHSWERNEVRFEVSGRCYEVSFENAVPHVPTRHRDHGAQAKNSSPRSPILQSTLQSETFQVIAPIPGIVLEVLVDVGTTVNTGDVLCRIEAMKMVNNIFAPRAGVVRQIFVEANSEVRDAQPLVEIAPLAVD